MNARDVYSHRERYWAEPPFAKPVSVTGILTSEAEQRNWHMAVWFELCSSQSAALVFSDTEHRALKQEWIIQKCCSTAPQAHSSAQLHSCTHKNWTESQMTSKCQSSNNDFLSEHAFLIQICSLLLQLLHQQHFYQIFFGGAKQCRTGLLKLWKLWDPFNKIK